MLASRTPPIVYLVLVMGVMLVGCTPPGTAPVGTESTISPTPSRAEGQSLWTVAGTEQHIPDDDADVQAVRTLVTVHSGVIDTRSPDAIQASVDEEFTFYTPEFAATLDATGWREASIERATSTAASVEQHGVAWMQSTIDEERTSANVRYASYIVFTSADDTFLTDNGVEIGREYVVVREVTAVVHDGTWLISAVRESGLQPRTTP